VSESTGFRTRESHLIQEFQENENIRRILIVDRPISLPEILLKKRPWKVKKGWVVYRRFNKSITQVTDKIYVLDIFSPELLKPVILKRRWWDYIFKKSSIINKIKEAIKHLCLNNIVLFLWNPFSTGIIGNLNESLIVFDAIDNFMKHPEAQDARKEALQGYDKIKKSADLIFTVSKAMKEFMENSRKNVFCIPNGVDIAFFQPGQDKEYLEDIKEIPKPIIGYVGRMAKRINIDLVSLLAIEMPDISFVFIGVILNKQWIRPLFKIPNIYFLGDKHYSLIPKYINSFDICIIPHNVGTLENDGDPKKLYEYLACAKPVVTSKIGGVGVFDKVISIANDKEEFLRAIQALLNSLKSGNIDREKLRGSISSEHFWKTKADFMIKMIMKEFEFKNKEKKISRRY
jgi:glycosyltransferase involved in cell wall biosynthesis